LAGGTADCGSCTITPACHFRDAEPTVPIHKTQANFTEPMLCCLRVTCPRARTGRTN
jgi:hypothetical protein